MSIMKSIADIKHVFYINLEARADRRTHVESQLAKVGLQDVALRFNAIRLQNGAMGCTLSHIKCLKTALENGWDHVLICEDDITFLDPDLFITQFNKCLANPAISSDWDVIMLGGNNMPPYTVIDDSCIKISRCNTTTGYLVNKHYIPVLLQNFKEGAELFAKNGAHMVSTYALDVHWRILQKPDNWYLITPPTVVQLEGYSDIEHKDVNYTRIMQDLDKPYLFNQLKKR